MMMAQSLLESGAIDSAAAAVFRTATDSARTVRALIDTRLSDGAVDAFARALTTRRAVSLVWAPDIRDGRLLMPAPDSAVAGVLRRVQPVYVTRLLDVIGAPAADATMRALLWTPSPVGLSALRLANDSLGLADARAARAATRVQLVRGEREGHIADAAKYTKLVEDCP